MSFLKAKVTLPNSHIALLKLASFSFAFFLAGFFPEFFESWQWIWLPLAGIRYAVCHTVDEADDTRLPAVSASIALGTMWKVVSPEHSCWQPGSLLAICFRKHGEASATLANRRKTRI